MFSGIVLEKNCRTAESGGVFNKGKGDSRSLWVTTVGGVVASNGSTMSGAEFSGNCANGTVKYYNMNPEADEVWPTLPAITEYGDDWIVDGVPCGYYDANTTGMCELLVPPKMIYRMLSGGATGYAGHLVTVDSDGDMGESVVENNEKIYCTPAYNGILYQFLYCMKGCRATTLTEV
ncbi:hypothetical protein HDU82_008637 [Entophlyctis luteolus]|nr:hypothetical protein HDU82_008637 [Entophlyctis luteolus]